MLTIGGSIPRGSRRCACAILLWTSCSATSMLRSSSNSTVMFAAPWREVEVTSLTPSTEVTASSRMSTTSVSMISGEAPSQVIGDVDHREVDVGVLADAEALEHAAEAGEGQQPEADQTEHQDPGEDVVADRDVRERHPGRDLVGVLLAPRRAAACRSAARCGGPRRVRASSTGSHRHAVGQAVGALGDDHLARLRGPTGSRRCRCRCAGRSRPAARAPCSPRHDVGDEAALARLHRALGHHERALLLLGRRASPRRRSPASARRRLSTQASTSTWRVGGSATLPTW